MNLNEIFLLQGKFHLQRMIKIPFLSTFHLLPFSFLLVVPKYSESLCQILRLDHYLRIYKYSSIVSNCISFAENHFAENGSQKFFRRKLFPRKTFCRKTVDRKKFAEKHIAEKLFIERKLQKIFLSKTFCQA